MESSPVPTEKQNTLWNDLGVPDQRPRTTTAQLYKRLDDLRKTKLEIEEERDKARRKLRAYRHMYKTFKLAYHGPLPAISKKLDKMTVKFWCTKGRVKELVARVDQLVKDYDTLMETVKQFRTEYKCVKCEEVKNVECFPKDPNKLLGIDMRCNKCQAEKARNIRKKKRII